GIERIAFDLLYRRDLLPVRLPLPLDDPLSLHHAYDHPAPRPALPANSRMPALVPGENLAVRNEQRNIPLDLLPTRSGHDAGRRRREHLKKMSPIHREPSPAALSTEPPPSDALWWGGPPGPQPAPRPSYASVFFRDRAGQGAGCGPGGPPYQPHLSNDKPRN